MKSKVFLTAASLLILAGCNGHTPAVGEFDATPVEIVVKVAYECGSPPPVQSIAMRDINWDIITVDEVDLFTLTVEDYQALGNNTSDWIAASKQMKEQRNFYRDCIERSQQEVEDENVDTNLVSGLSTGGS